MTRSALVIGVSVALILAFFGLAAGGRAQDEPNDLDNLQATAEAHETEIADLAATVGAHEDALEAQETEIADLGATAEAHAAELEAQQTEIAALEERVVAGETAAAEVIPTTESGMATPVAELGEVLYEADATGGLDEWTGSADWLHRDGMLVNDGSSRTSLIVAPYQPGDVSDYAVEAEIRLIRCDSGPAQRQGFGLAARGEERGGYWGGLNLCINGDRATIWAADLEADEYDRLTSQEFRSDSEWHTYRLEVRGDVIRLFIDGEPAAETRDLRYVDAGQVGLWSITTQIEVRTFRVLALS